MSERFIGAGWAFPLRTDSTGGVALVALEREIEESIRLILGTAYGERPMRPEFGCGVHEYVFAAANATTAGRISSEVRASLDRWEPRITVDGVDVTFAADDAAVLHIAIRYTVCGSYSPRNLVFPFYLIPGHEPSA